VEFEPRILKLGKEGSLESSGRILLPQFIRNAAYCVDPCCGL
jgi:hypothetical protein